MPPLDPLVFQMLMTVGSSKTVRLTVDPGTASQAELDELVEALAELMRLTGGTACVVINPAPPPPPRAWRWTPRLRPVLAWFDCWIGAYWDRRNRTLYLLPLPFVGLALDFSRPCPPPSPTSSPSSASAPSPSSSSGSPS